MTSQRPRILEWLVLALVFLAALSVEVYLRYGYDGFLGAAVFLGLFAVTSELEIVGHELMQTLGHGDDEPGPLRRLAERLERE